jgi:glycosyltransferase involved in cell wall biosynthesis
MSTLKDIDPVSELDEDSTAPASDTLLRVMVLSFEYPLKAGAGTHVHELVSGLDRSGCRVTLLAPTTGEPKTYCEGGVKVHLVSPSAATCESVSKSSPVQGVLVVNNDLIAYGESLIASEAPRPDVIHFHDWYTYKAASEFRRRFDIPIVGTSHSTSEPIVRWWGEVPDDEIVREERSMYHNTDALITVSQSMSTLMQAAYEIPAHKIHVVHNALDLQAFTQPQLKPDKLRLLRQTIAAPGEKIVLFAGRLTVQKNIAGVYASAARVIAEYPNVCYVLAGEPDSLNSSEVVENLKQRYANLKDQIKLLGRVPRKYLALLYQVADLALVPSIYEPFGYAGIEAMAAGVPVIATQVGGLAEIITHDETGLLVRVHATVEGTHQVDTEELAAAQLLLLRDEKKAEQLGAAGRRRVMGNFNIERMIQSTLEVYQQTIMRFQDARGASSSYRMPPF